MAVQNFRQIKAIERANKERILKICPDARDESGIYFLLREENGFKYAYIGQSVKVLTRLAQHLKGYQHIDISIKKHKLWSENNPTGWRIGVMACDKAQLDELEQKYIKMYADRGYQLRNKTSGSQGEGKQGIAENKPAKGYYDGKAQGYLDAQRYVANLFDKHLKYGQKSDKPNKNQEKAVAKFEMFLEGGRNKDDRCS